MCACVFGGCLSSHEVKENSGINVIRGIVMENDETICIGDEILKKILIKILMVGS